jgi:hypothetical protein
MTSDVSRKSDESSDHVVGILGVIVGDLVNVTWRMALPPVLMIGLGYWFDKTFATKPVGFLVGAALGTLAGLWMGVRAINASKGRR